MAITDYKIVASPSFQAASSTINELLKVGWQPYNAPFADNRGQMCQALVMTGDFVPPAPELPATSAIVKDGDTVTIKAADGNTVVPSTAVVNGSVLGQVNVGPGAAIVFNGQPATGLTVDGTFVDTVTFSVSNGAVTGITLS